MQIAIAFWNAGELRLMADPDDCAIPPLAGKVGSGKPGTPCLRMHCANTTAARFWLSVIGDGAVPPPKSLHAFSADTNTGPENVVLSTVRVELPGVAEIEKPEPPDDSVGSGKFETPCERMQSDMANADFAEELASVVVPLG